MSHGHLKISRESYKENPLWNESRRFSRWEAWEDLQQMAAWKKYVRVTTACVVELERGEFVASRRYLATRWQWGVQKVRTFIEYLKKSGQILTQRETQMGTVYFLIKYDDSQAGHSPSNPLNNPPVTHRQPTGNPKKKQLSSKAVKQEELIRVFDEQFWPAYPRRSGGQNKAEARKAFIARVTNDKIPADRLVSKAEDYRKYIDATRTEPRFVKMASSWLRKSRGWEESWAVPEEPMSEYGTEDFFRAPQ